MDRAPALRLKPLLLAWCIFLLTVEFFGVVFAGSAAHTQFDFEEYYTAGYLMRIQPSQVYNLARQESIQHAHAPHSSFLPFFHPEYEAVLFAPLSFLTYKAAYLCFIACNALLVLAALLALQRTLSNHAGLQSPAWLIFFLFPPLLIALVVGQDSILLLLLYCLAWQQLESGKDISAGLILALALFKFHITIPIAALIALRQGGRFCVGFLAASAGVGLLCFGIVGSAGTMEYIRLMSGAVSAIDRSGGAQHGMEFFPSALTNLAGLLYGCGARFQLSSHAFNALVAACSLGLFVWCAAVIRHSEQRVAFSIAVLCALLVSYHSFIYDIVLALLPIVLLAGRTPRYILLSLYILPLVLLPFGAKWFFPAAVPVLAMLVYTLVSDRKSATPSIQLPRVAAV